MICKEQFPWQSLRNKWCLISQGLVAAEFNTIRKKNTLQGISWLQEFSSTCLCVIHPLFSCMMVASGNRSPSLWCMKLSRTGVPPLCQISLVLFLLPWKQTSPWFEQLEHQQSPCTTTCGEDFCSRPSLSSSNMFLHPTKF